MSKIASPAVNAEGIYCNAKQGQAINIASPAVISVGNYCIVGGGVKIFDFDGGAVIF